MYVRAAFADFSFCLLCPAASPLSFSTQSQMRKHSFIIDSDKRAQSVGKTIIDLGQITFVLFLHLILKTAPFFDTICG
jgi:hypothetical protein